MVLHQVTLDRLWHCLSVFSWFFLKLPWIDCDIFYMCFMVLPHVALNWLWHCLSVFSWFFLMLNWINCDIVYLCSYGSSSGCIGLIVTLFFCVFMVLRHVAFDLLWHCLSWFPWFFLMLHCIDCDIVYLCSYGSSLCCIGLIVTLFICVLIVLLHVALNWLWYCYSVFSWFFVRLLLIYCDIVYLGSHASSSCCIGLIVILLICALMGLPYVALNWLWHCLSEFLWFSFMLHWIDCNIVILCSYGSSSCCLGLIVISFFLCYHGSSSWCFWFIVTLFIFVLMVLPCVALNWFWHWLSVFLWVFLMLHWIDCDIVYLCSYRPSSCCIELIVTLFICVLMVLPHVALDWLWHCLSVFSWFLLMLHWIDCDSIYLCSYGSSLCCIWLLVTFFNGSSSCCIGLIVTLFISVLMVPPRVAFNWLWHCLSVFLWFFLVLHWIDCDIVYLCFYGSFLCCIRLIVTLFISIIMVLPHVALDSWLHCLSLFLWFFLMLHWIECDIVFLGSYGSTSSCIELIWGCLSVFSWFFLMLHWIHCDIVNLCFYGSTLCCIG